MLFLLIFGAFCRSRRRHREFSRRNDDLEADTYRGGWHAGFTPTPTPCPFQWKDEIRKDISNLETKLDGLYTKIRGLREKIQSEEDRHVDTYNNLTDQFHRQIDLLQWEIDNHYQKYKSADTTAQASSEQLQTRRSSLESEVAILRQRKKDLQAAMIADEDGYKKFVIEQQKLDVANRAKRKKEHNSHIDTLSIMNEELELTRNRVAELISVVRSMKEELKKKKKEQDEDEDENENDDLDEEFRKLWQDDDTEDSSGKPRITPMPPILPPEDDIENPRRVLQFPQYCCRCELRKKLM